MYKKKLALIIATAIIVSGCDNAYDSASSKVSSAREEVINMSQIDKGLSGSVADAIAKEKAELATYLTEMQKTDPTVKDLYYTYSESGEKLLHLIRDPAAAATGAIAGASTQETSPPKDSSSNLEDFMWGMAGGLTGAMLFNAFSNGGMKSMTNSYQPKSNTMFPRNDYNNRKNLATSNYRNTVFNMNKNKVLANGGKPISNISTNNSGYRNNTTMNTNRNIDTSKKLTPVSPPPHQNVMQKPKKSYSFGMKKKRR